MNYSHVVVWIDHQDEFIHYLEAYQPALRSKVLGVEASDRISDGQLLAMARRWFGPVDQMRGTTLR